MEKSFGVISVFITYLFWRKYSTPFPLSCRNLQIWLLNTEIGNFVRPQTKNSYKESFWHLFCRWKIGGSKNKLPPSLTLGAQESISKMTPKHENPKLSKYQYIIRVEEKLGGHLHINNVWFGKKSPPFFG